MLLSTAILVGLFGSFHCLGMCAPITWAMPADPSRRSTWWLSKVSYNLGRIITYAAMGAIMGLAGELLSFGQWQQWLSIFAGMVLIVGVLLLRGKISEVPMIKPLGKLVVWIKTRMTGLIMSKGWKGHLSLGLVNGMLPCGLVYTALVGAISMGSVVGSASYMALFGLGTIPMMVAAAVLGKMAGQKMKWRISRWAPRFIVFLGFLFILRGLNLGIPYVSPQITDNEAIVECSVNTFGSSFIEVPD